MKGSDILPLAKSFIGRGYHLGAIVPKDVKNFTGLFDCAEFAAYNIFQTYGFLYGCDTHDIKGAHTADAYTGYFDTDAHKFGKIISVDEATRTPGAFALRIPTGSAIGHIVISQGTGDTIEANSTKYGCGEFHFTGRRFDLGILLPGVEYETREPIVSHAPLKTVFRLKTPVMDDPYVGLIQRALGFSNAAIDNKYGINTQAKVVAFQRANGLVIDGEVQIGGQTAKALKI